MSNKIMTNKAMLHNHSSLRYQNELVCQHLAGQYVAGVMTSRVRRRTESLREVTPELDRAIAGFADSFSDIHQQLPSTALSTAKKKLLWENIEHELERLQPPSSDTLIKDAVSSWWNQLFIWRLGSVAGAFASLCLAVLLLNTPPAQTPSTALVGPSYLANMSAHSEGNNESGSEIQFVISAYQKSGDMLASRLNIQWLKAADSTVDSVALSKSKQALHLWAEDKETGKLTYIGLEPEKGQAWNLTKPAWLAITSSSRLLMTSDQQAPTGTNTLFSGLCLQLKEWKQSA